MDTAGTRLRKWRKDQGLSLKKLATDVGAHSATTISDVERGRVQPSYALALAIELRTGRVCTVEDFGFDRATARRIPQAESSR